MFMGFLFMFSRIQPQHPIMKGYRICVSRSCLKCELYIDMAIADDRDYSILTISLTTKHYWTVA
jgi:hypothetical protein